jgi:lysophospholipase L1-like esterase
MGHNRPASALFLTLISAIFLQFASAQGLSGNWIGSWGAASYAQVATNLGQGSGDFTYRNIVHTSAGGSAIRVQLTNEYGTAPLTVGPVQVALSAGGGAIQGGTNQALTFGGNPMVTIPAGAVVFSDPLQFNVPALTSLAVSLYVPPQTVTKASCHPFAVANSYMSASNTVASIPGGTAALTWCYLRGIDVEAATAGSTVALGDSITDGWESTTDGNKRYTDYLASALQANPATTNVGVLNKGILSNELLGIDAFIGYGPAGSARLNGDVFSETGVAYLIVLEGINDLGYANPSGGIATADALIAGYQQLIAQAHNHGIKVYGCTLTPTGGTAYYPTIDDSGRQAVNAWIRTNNAFDAFIDFDAALSNNAVPPAVPALLKQYDSGDHLHPNSLGYSVMAQQISLSLFGAPSSPATKK